MTIQNWSEYRESIWDWAIADGCFTNSKASISDIDGIIERKGHFVVIETKGVGASILKGQEVLLTKLSEQQNFMVVVLWGNPGKVEEMRIVPYDTRAATTEDFRDVMKKWWLYANGKEAWRYFKAFLDEKQLLIRG